MENSDEIQAQICQKRVYLNGYMSLQRYLKAFGKEITGKLYNVLLALE